MFGIDWYWFVCGCVVGFWLGCCVVDGVCGGGWNGMVGLLC